MPRFVLILFMSFTIAVQPALAADKCGRWYKQISLRAALVLYTLAIVGGGWGSKELYDYWLDTKRKEAQRDLDAAARAGDLAKIKLLLRYDPGQSIIHQATVTAFENNQEEAALFLFDIGGSPEGWGGHERLMEASIKHSNLKLMKAVLDAGGDINYQVGRALREDPTKRNPALVKFLLDNGARVDTDGARQLMVDAIENNRSETVELLLEKGFRQGFENGYLLNEAVEAKNAQLVEVLLDKGASPVGLDLSALREAFRIDRRDRTTLSDKLLDRIKTIDLGPLRKSASHSGDVDMDVLKTLLPKTDLQVAKADPELGGALLYSTITRIKPPGPAAASSADVHQLTKTWPADMKLYAAIDAFFQEAQGSPQELGYALALAKMDKKMIEVYEKLGVDKNKAQELIPAASSGYDALVRKVGVVTPEGNRSVE